jgi:hypothetical protein
VDDRALRQALVVCGHCGTILRVGPEGLERHEGPVPDASRPDGVEIERVKSGELSLRARARPGSWLRRWQKPLRLRDGFLLPAGAAPLPVREIRGIHAAVSHTDHGGGNVVTHCNVFALRSDGARVRLIGPLADPATALWVEELLECELRLFDLPVFGEAALPERGAAAGNWPSDRFECTSCGARVEVGDADVRRGLAECADCRGLTLLRDPRDGKPLLGLPDLTASPFLYRVVERADGVQLVPDDPGSWSLVEVSGGEVRVRRPGKRERKLAAAALSAVRVRASARQAGAVDFEIVARGPGGQDVRLVEGLADPREAFLLEQSLERALSGRGG